MISGQTPNISVRKQDMSNQKIPALGFTKIFFASKLAAGASGVNLSSLTTPPEMSANGFVNPTASQIQNANLLFFQNNLTLVSSLRGMLQKNLSYVIAGSSQINFLGFTAIEGEIITGTIDYGAMTGLKVVDATATPATGTLPAGTTDFNIGQFFQTNKYSTTQIGACTVYLDGVQQYRNPANSSTTTTGNYYEVDNGGGSFSVIRFNLADPDNVRNVMVIPTGLLSERPDGSMMAVIESIQGQINSLAPYIATLAGLPTTTILGSAPTNVDLKAFGDRVLALEQTRAFLNINNAWTSPQSIPGSTSGAAQPAGDVGEEVKAVSTVLFDQASPAQNTIYDIPSMSITLNPGNWDIYVMTGVQANVTSAGATLIALYLRDSNNNAIQSCITGGGTSTISLVTPAFLTKRVNISTATTYKAGITWASFSGSPTVGDIYSRGDLINGGAYILARRVP